MASAIYQHPADNVASTAIITASAEDTAYPATYLVDGRFTRPSKLTTTTGNYVFAFAGAQRLDILALGPHTLDPGLSVQIQANTSNAWGAPAFSANLVIPALDIDGRQTLPWLDLTAQAGYSAGGWAWWRLLIGANSRIVMIGEIWLGALKRSFERNINWGLSTDEDHRLIEHETEYGIISAYDLQVRQRQLSAQVTASDTGLGDLRNFHRAMRGRVYPGLLIPDPAVNDAWWVRQGVALQTTSNFFDNHDVPLQFEELSQGIPL